MPVWWRLLALVVACSATGCGEEEDRPPPLGLTGGAQNPVSCDALRKAAPNPGKSGGFFVSGGVAECASEGLWCPVEWVTGQCDGGLAYAQCVADKWLFTCALASDGGVTVLDIAQRSFQDQLT